MSSIKAWPLPTGRPADLPHRIKRPCDWEIEAAAYSAEVQVGTIEAYNRLVAQAERLRARIERGDIKAQNPLYAKNIRGGS